MNRNIVTCIILTVITCGIYGIYWFIVITDDVARVTDDHSMSGGVSFLLNLITCGIYGIYWAFQMGRKLYDYSNKNNLGLADNAIVYLLLQIFGFGIVNYALIQNDLNRLSQSN